LRIVVWATLGLSSVVNVEKLYFVDTNGTSLNQMVRKFTFQPKNGFEAFSPNPQRASGSQAATKLSALFVDPKKIIDAPAQDYTTLTVDFSRTVNIGAILFYISRDKPNENIKHVLVYSNDRLVFNVVVLLTKGEIMNRHRVQNCSDRYASIVFCPELKDFPKLVQGPSFVPTEFMNEPPASFSSLQ
jgi:hypothetical protein